MSEFKILIVGAGIAGLSLSRSLHKLGICHTIIDKENGPNTEGAGIALPFNAVRALKALGIADKVLALAHKVNAINYVKATGKLLAKSDLSQPPFENDQFIALRRSDLHAELRSDTQQAVHYGCRINAIKANTSSNSVTCSLPELNGEYDLVVAADGVNSATRSLVYKHKKLVYEHDIVTWRFLHKMPNHNIQPTYYLGKTDVFMIYPVSPDEVYCYAHIHSQSRFFNAEASAISNMKRLFSTYAEPIPTILTSVSEKDVIQGKLKSVVSPNYYFQRVAFIGDAANACSPLLQQGAASAFEDALCLSECLAHFDPDIALKKYKTLRKARVEWTVNYSDSPLKAAVKMEKAIPRFLRNLIIKLIGPLNVYGWKKLATGKRLQYLTPNGIRH